MNHWPKLRSVTLEEMESVMTVKVNSLELPSMASGARAARMMPAESDIMTNMTTRNTDFAVFWGRSRCSVRSSMFQNDRVPFLKGYPVIIGRKPNLHHDEPSLDEAIPRHSRGVNLDSSKRLTSCPCATAWPASPTRLA